MAATKRILVTGATGKVGQAFLHRLFEGSKLENFVARALLHNRDLDVHDRLEIARGSIQDAETVNQAMTDVTHGLHLATCKEIPSQIMDVAVKGLFWLLEACRTSPTFEQFILIGGDAAVGHFFYPHAGPVTETQKHTAYPGCYALSKVLEEVMLEQYYVQYDLNGCCLRAPWIMDKDDFKYHLSFGEDVFGGPRWRDLVGPEQADVYAQAQTIPVMLDPDGRPVKRNFVHVSDLVSAIFSAIDTPEARQQTFNICMNEPIDYRAMADYLTQTRGLPTVDIPTRYYSTWLDNSKARFLLDWQPDYDLRKMIDAAWEYQRAEDDPRLVWYPG
jgi:UDP-glucose 4-epimerase